MTSVLELSEREEELLGVLESAQVGLRPGLEILVLFRLAVSGGEEALVSEAQKSALLARACRIIGSDGAPGQAAADEAQATPAVPKELGKRMRRCGVCGGVKGLTAFKDGGEVCRKCAGHQRGADGVAVTKRLAKQAQASAGEHRHKLQSGYQYPAREGTSGLRRCPYCDERKPVKGFKGEACGDCSRR